MVAPQQLPILCSQAPYGQDCCCCNRCNVGGCDLKVMPCGCCMHARCCPISDNHELEKCPVCGVPAVGLHLIPLTFDEIDQATAEAAKTSLTNKRGKKRQNATVARLNPASQSQSAAATLTNEESKPSSIVASNELRTGRWTSEETAYCDKLIHCFEQGSLPIPEKMKLNDFLSSMLKSKPSRLTKKMKNANLSAKQYRRSPSLIMSELEAREISQLETALFESIKCRMERCELRFHMQKVWRDLFSHFCARIGQKLELEGWLRSVEEMERRTSDAWDAARKARRLAMIGALSEDTKNAQTGVLIDPHAAVDRSNHVVFDQNDYVDGTSESDSFESGSCNKKPRTLSTHGDVLRARAKSTSFVTRVMHYIQLRQIPFEHVDLWVPSGNNVLGGGSQGQRLVFGGCATAESKMPPDSPRSSMLTAMEQQNLISFGEYSQRFSFDLGSGLPGRVYSSGIPSWEQGIKSAPQSLFERCGGARQWGIETAVGMSISSPSVGRIIVVLYSIYDRCKDPNLVSKMMEDTSKLLPIPRWKLVVDVGADMLEDMTSFPSDSRETDLKCLLENLVQGDIDSAISQQIVGLSPLIQILDKRDRSDLEAELLQDTLHNYGSYKRQGRTDLEVAWLTCRDFILKEANVRNQNNDTCIQRAANQPPACGDASPFQNPYTEDCPNVSVAYHGQSTSNRCCAQPTKSSTEHCSTSEGSSDFAQSNNTCCAPSALNKTDRSCNFEPNNTQMDTNQFSLGCAAPNAVNGTEFPTQEMTIYATKSADQYQQNLNQYHQGSSNASVPTATSHFENEALFSGSTDLDISAVQLSRLLHD